MRFVPFSRILWLTACVVALPWLALTVAALPTMSAYIAPEQIARAEAVGNIVASSIEVVVGLEIPLAEEPGMKTYLDEILSENPGIGFIAVCDEQGRIVSAAQSFSDGSVDLKLGPGSSIVRVEAIRSGLAFVSHDIMKEGHRLGVIVVGQSLHVPAALANDLLLDSLIGLAVLVLFSLESVRLLLGVCLVAPLTAAAELLARVVAKDLGRCLALNGTGVVDELVAVTNRVVKALHDRCAELLAYAEEVRMAGQDRNLGPAIADRLAVVLDEVRLPEAVPLEVPRRPSAAFLRFIWFLLSVGAGACWSLESSVDSLVLWSLSALVAGGLALSLLRAGQLRYRAAVALGCALAIFVSLQLVPVSVTWLTTVLFGSGIALISSVLARLPCDGAGAVDVSPAILGGVAAGVGIAAVTPPDRAAPIWVGAALIAIAWLMTLALSRRPGSAYTGSIQDVGGGRGTIVLVTRLSTWLVGGIIAAALQSGALQGEHLGVINSTELYRGLFVLILAVMMGYAIGVKFRARLASGSLVLRLAFSIATAITALSVMHEEWAMVVSMTVAFLFGSLWGLDGKPGYARVGKAEVLAFAAGMLVVERQGMARPELLAMFAALPALWDFVSRGKAIWSVDSRRAL